MSIFSDDRIYEQRARFALGLPISEEDRQILALCERLGTHGFPVHKTGEQLYFTREGRS